MNKYLLLLLFTCVNTACVNNAGSVDEIANFPHTYPIEQYECVYTDGDTSYLGAIRDMDIVDGKMVVYNTCNSYFFSIIDAITGKLSRWGQAGRGAGEYIQLGTGFSVRDHQLVLWDPAMRQINYVPLNVVFGSSDSIVVRKESFAVTGNFRPLHFVAVRDMKIAVGAFAQGRFGILDSLNNMVDCPFDYPFSFDQIQGIYRGAIFQSQIKTNEKQNKFVVQTAYSDNFEIYQATPNGIEQCYKSPSVLIPQLKEKPGQGGVTHTIDGEATKAGFMRIAVSEELICLTYSSKSYNQAANDFLSSDEILCFDWQGNKVKKYVLPFQITNFCLDKQYIYGVVNFSDAAKIYRFKMI